MAAKKKAQSKRTRRSRYRRRNDAERKRYEAEQRAHRLVHRQEDRRQARNAFVAAATLIFISAGRREPMKEAEKLASQLDQAGYFEVPDLHTDEMGH